MLEPVTASTVSTNVSFPHVRSFAEIFGSWFTGIGHVIIVEAEKKNLHKLVKHGQERKRITTSGSVVLDPGITPSFQTSAAPSPALRHVLVRRPRHVGMGATPPVGNFGVFFF